MPEKRFSSLFRSCMNRLLFKMGKESTTATYPETTQVAHHGLRGHANLAGPARGVIGAAVRVGARPATIQKCVELSRGGQAFIPGGRECLTGASHACNLLGL